MIGSATISVHVLCEVHPRSVLAAFSPCCQVINLSLFLAFVACLWLHEWEGRTWTWQGGSEVGGQGWCKGVLRARTVTKAARTWTCRCCCCALSVWAIWKLQQGCKQPLRGRFLTPNPSYHSQPLLSIFCQRHCLAKCVCVCVFRSCANFLWLEENNPQVADTLVCVWQCQLGRLQAAKCTCPAFPWPLPDPTPLPPFWHTHVSQSQPFFS